MRVARGEPARGASDEPTDRLEQGLDLLVGLSPLWQVLPRHAPAVVGRESGHRPVVSVGRGVRVQIAPVRRKVAKLLVHGGGLRPHDGLLEFVVRRGDRVDRNAAARRGRRLALVSLAVVVVPSDRVAAVAYDRPLLIERGLEGRGVGLGLAVHLRVERILESVVLLSRRIGVHRRAGAG